jgi:hypothetical protein
MATDFDLLGFIGVQSPDLPTSEEERRMIDRRRKQAFDDMQYQAHIEQEKRRRERAEHNLSGKCHHFPQRDTLHHYGNYWFGQGTVPSTHDVVGRAPIPPADHPITHSIDGIDAAPPYATGGSRTTRARSRSPRDNDVHFVHDEFATPTTYSRKRDAPVVVLRSRTPPPSPASVAARWNRADAFEASTPTAAPRTPRGTLPPFGSRSPGRFHPTARTMTAAAVPLTSNDTALSAPYATDTIGLPTSALMGPSPHADRDGLLRGAGGGLDEIEGAARAAQRLEEDIRRRAAYEHKKRMQEDMRRDLDAAIDMRRYVRAEERRQTDEAVFGMSLPIPTAEPRTRLEMQRRQREDLERTWRQQAYDHYAREADEKARTAPDRRMWWLDAERREAETAADHEAHVVNPKDSWKRAWQEHQANQAALEKEQRKAAAWREENELSVNVANYADRIILAEQQRREAQKAFKAQLDEQVRSREYNQKSLIAENYRRDRRFHRPPFDRYPTTNLGPSPSR